MLDRLARLLEVSPAVAAIVLVLAIAQLATQAYALVHLARSDAVRGGRKWVWALVIALGNLPGAIAYLAAGRPASPVDVPGAGSGASPAGGEAARRAVDVLYNSGDER
jgi:Phospholipase_D-nuclease N-terminal